MTSIKIKVKIIMNKICANPHCGKEFETSNGRTKYCSQKCAKYMHEHSHDIEKNGEFITSFSV